MPAASSDIIGPLERISRHIATFGAIIAAIVGINTAVTTCSSQTVSRYQTFQKAVEAEDLYWRSLYSDYLSVFRREVSDDERQARLFTLSVLAQREIPNFDEHYLGLFEGDGARMVAQARLSTMKSRLNEALSRPESSTDALARQRQDQNFVAAIGAVRTQSDRESPPSPQVAPATLQVPAVATGVNYLPQTLAAGDPQGWDFDVFWCGGGGPQVEAVNYTTGLRAAQSLAELSAGDGRLAEERLGRVRLIMLPENRQGAEYPARGSGREIRAEPSEAAIGSALRETIPGGGSYRLIASDRRSAWYVSLFTCAAGQRPAGRPAPNAGTAAS